MRRSFLLISFAAMWLSTAASAFAQNAPFPSKEGEKAKYSVMIEFPKAYISGIGVIAFQEGRVVGTVFNEFGVSAISFTYDEAKNKVKLLSMIGKLNRWYVKRVVKNDLKHVLHVLKKSGTTYINEKQHIIYNWHPLAIQE